MAVPGIGSVFTLLSGSFVGRNVKGLVAFNWLHQVYEFVISWLLAGECRIHLELVKQLEYIAYFSATLVTSTLM
jgi:hypothetical protein